MIPLYANCTLINDHGGFQMTVIAYNCTLIKTYMESTIVRSTLINDHGGPVTVIAYNCTLIKTDWNPPLYAVL